MVTILGPITYTCYAIPETPSWWPLKRAGQTKTYALDITTEIDPDVDIITSATAVCAPSGSGELQISNLQVSGTVLYLTTSQGQPTRVYSVLFTLPMQNGNDYQFQVYQGVPPGLPGYTIPPPPVPGYGDPVSWSSLTFLSYTIPVLWGF